MKHSLFSDRLYRITCYVLALLFLGLFIQFMFFPQMLFDDLALSMDTAALVLLRRACMFILGFCVLAFGARRLSHSAARQTICLANAVMLLGLALSGGYAFWQGSVSSNIMISMLVETSLGLSFLWIFAVNHSHHCLDSAFSDGRKKSVEPFKPH